MSVPRNMVKTVHACI